MRLEGITSNDPFISLIDRAQEEILMASYKLQEKKLPQKDLLNALERAVSRGVSVHLIAENRLADVEILEESKEVKKGDSLRAYQKQGVQVYSTKGSYNQSHAKFIIADRKEAILGNTNFDKDPKGVRSHQAPSRDFAVLTKNAQLIEELVDGFWSDVKGVNFPKRYENLIWGPEKQRDKFYTLIASAKASIRIYQQDITDKEIVQQLLNALKRNIEVELIMSPHPFGWNNPDHNVTNQQELIKAGAHVYLVASVSVHAKVFVIDDQTMYLGSTNFYQPAIDQNRNVGLLTFNKELINQVLQIFERDKFQKSN